MATYYVDPVNGVDTNARNGLSTGAAWKTLKYTEAKIAAGDTVRLMNGTYSGAGNVFTITKDNTTWMAHTGATPVLDGGYHKGLLEKCPPDAPSWFSSRIQYSMPDPRAKKSDGTYVYPNIEPRKDYTPFINVSAHGVTIDGLTIQNSVGRPLLIEEYHQLTLKNCNFYWFYTNLEIRKSSGTTVENCKFLYGGTYSLNPYQTVERVKGTYPGGSMLAFRLCKFIPGRTTPDGYTLVFRNNYGAVSQGEGFGFIVSQGSATAPILIERNILQDNYHAALYGNHIRHAIFRYNIHINTFGVKIKGSSKFNNHLAIRDEMEQGDFSTPTWYPDTAAHRIITWRSNDVATYGNILVNPSAPAILFDSRRTDAKRAGADQPIVEIVDPADITNLYYGFNTVLENKDHNSNAGDTAISISMGNGKATGILENNFFWGKAGNNPTRLVVRNNYWEKKPNGSWQGANSNFADSDKTSIGGIIKAFPKPAGRGIPQPVPDGKFQNFHDIVFQANGTLSDIDLANYKTIQNGPLRNKAAARAAAGGMTPPLAAYTGDRYTQYTVNRNDIGWLEFESDVTNTPPTTPPTDPNPGTVTARFSLNPRAIMAGESVSVNASNSTASSPTTISSYVWDWGDGSLSDSGVTASHRYTVAGTYSIRLTVTNNNGSTGSIVKALVVNERETTGKPVTKTATAIFAAPTNTNDLEVSLAMDGATPEGLMFELVGATSVGTLASPASATPVIGSLGFWTPIEYGAVHAWRSRHDSTPGSFRAYREGGVAMEIDITGNVAGLLRVRSVAEDKIVVRASTAFSSAFRIRVTAFGGPGIKAERQTFQLSGGMLDVSQPLKFKPDLIFVAHTSTISDVVESGTSPHLDVSIGIGLLGTGADSDELRLRQHCVNWTQRDGFPARPQLRNYNDKIASYALASNGDILDGTVEAFYAVDIDGTNRLRFRRSQNPSSARVTMMTLAYPAPLQLRGLWSPSIADKRFMNFEDAEAIIALTGRMPATGVATDNRAEGFGIHITDANDSATLGWVVDYNASPSAVRSLATADFATFNYDGPIIESGAVDLSDTNANDGDKAAVSVNFGTVENVSNRTIVLLIGEGDTFDETNPPPVANFSHPRPRYEINETIQFTNLSNGNGLEYTSEWDFGDDTESTARNPRKFFAAAGTYTVRLTVNTASGSNSQSKNVVVYDPNGDDDGGGDREIKRFILGGEITALDVTEAITESRFDVNADSATAGQLALRLKPRALPISEAGYQGNIRAGDVLLSFDPDTGNLKLLRSDGTLGMISVSYGVTPEQETTIQPDYNEEIEYTLLRTSNISVMGRETASNIASGRPLLDGAGRLGFIPFENFSVPQGSTIVEAIFQFKAREGKGIATPGVDFYMEDTDDAELLNLDDNKDISTRALTDAKTTLTGIYPGGTSSWIQVNMTTSVQELVDRAGFTSNTVAVICEATSNDCNLDFLSWATFDFPTISVRYTV